ncbi:LPS export ABC transporter permease LptF [Stappia sp. F7233]|uniref:LPS export ABC transporter permease LptF n=1 Tax=Stappia albiluteola TaxID=2758565 RepID=A0A839ABB0_9HYPH|nr:LPS export ABC transporter permease LptF [Stappia albiluteola]MBA5776711.1 LPS export ABC transporter permease LptF [Stappia albiluteola]
MKTFERYVLRRLTFTFMASLAALAGVVWATQALRELDLVTSKGQTIVQFIGITMLAMPFLLLIVAPFALLIALILVLNALSQDSELIVISASGASRSILLRPVIVFSAAVSLLCAVLSTYISPASLALLRNEVARVRVDLVANIVKPGRFIGVEDGLTFHIRNRSGDGQLDGLMLHDERAEDTIFTYEAARGHIIEAADRTLLVMQDGTIQRRSRGSGAISIIRFQSYAFDLSNLIPEASAPVYKPSERSMAELMWPSPDDRYAAEKRERFVAELHDRLSQPLYPLAFGMIVFAFLGNARTTRQSRNLALLAAIIVPILLRTAGFGALTLISSVPSARFALYAVPVAGFLIAVWFNLASSHPAWLERIHDRLEQVTERLESFLSRRSAGPTGGAV